MEKKTKIAIAVLVAVAIIGCGIGYALTSSNGESEPEEVAASNETETEVEQVTVDHVAVKVECDGWDAETSTPIVVTVYEGDVYDALVNPEEGEETPEAMSLVDVAAGEETVIEDIVDEGTYTLAIAGSPILEDGTIFNLPEPVVIEYEPNLDAAGLAGEEAETESETETEVETEGETYVDVTTKVEILPLELDEEGNETDDYYQLVTFTLVAKAAEEVSEQDIQAATEAAEIAGADTETITQNTSKTTETAAAAQGGTIQQSSSGYSGTGSSGTSNATTSSSNSSSNSNSGSNSGSSSSSGNSTTNESTGGSGNTSSTETHTCTWVPTYETVHHDAVYTTVHHDAVYTTVHHDAVTETYSYIQCSCGATFSTNSEWTVHNKENLATHSYSVKYGTRVVSEAYDESVLVSDAYDEQVLVTAAYDETVVTGYVCSTCGATK